MSNYDMMPVETDAETMWTLTEDRQAVRLALPPLPLVGLPEPLRVHVDFEAEAIDAMIERLATSVVTDQASHLKCGRRTGGANKARGQPRPYFQG
jgi:hypothetical protein